MTILTHGKLTLPQPHQPFFFSSWDLLGYQMAVDGPSTLAGYNMLVNSDETFNAPLTNNGTLVLEDGSDLTIQNNLSGSGSIVANDSSVLIAGTSAASQTLILMNNSNLYLGMAPGLRLSSPIDIDSTSTIHFYTNPTEWASDLTSGDYNLAIGLTNPPANLIGGMAYVNSLTPGYTPEAVFTFGPGGEPIGVTIVDKPTPSATSTTDTIVGSTVTDPTGSISATDHSTVNIDTATTPTSETISLDSTSELDIGAPVGMQFLATIDMTAGSLVYLYRAFQNGVTSVTEYPQLNLVDFFAGSTLEAQLHIHNESSGTTIWAGDIPNSGGLFLLTNSISPPEDVKFIPIPTHVIG